MPSGRSLKSPANLPMLLAILSLLGAATTQTTQPATQPWQSTTQPVLKSPGELKMHHQFLDLAKAGNIDLLFVGDSITDSWRRPDRGLAVWQKYFAPLKAANFGISGDRTQHVLWRIQNGELDGFNAKCIVLMLGTNNLSSPPNNIRNTNEETIAGMKCVVAAIRQHQPQAKLLLLGIFPRGQAADNPYRRDIKVVNAELAKWDDGKNIFYLDIGDKFLNPDGTLKTELFFDGNLHPNAAGYEVWAAAIIDKVKALLAMP
ncbi:MAG: GDSL-type esterase/lipase family protein [Tepidisphaeraceae bacterium]|jgi:lysophospholipase L1-like esterase